MPRHSNKERILTEGLRVVHERGFGAASVRDIVQAAGVPHGSFTNHFATKEAFGLEILDLYFTNSQEVIRDTLRNEALSPLKRLRAYLHYNKKQMGACDMRNGCLFGNFTAEASEHSEVLRHRLTEIFAAMEQSVAHCLKAAVAQGEVPESLKCNEVAGFIVSSLQGAILLAKAQRSLLPVERFERVLFSSVLAKNQ